MTAPNRQIPPERKTLYLIGQVVGVIGMLCFLSVFVTFFMNFGNFENFDGQARSFGFRAVGGIVMIIVGGAITNIAARGLAGSGVILDPDQARKDTEPWNRMAGGMIQDTISEIDVVNKLAGKFEASAPETAIKVRCPKCRALNGEAAKYCDQCGASL